MFEACLSDPAHGVATAQGNTAAEAVDLAFQDLAKGWRHPADKPEPFDGSIVKLTDDVSEVWWWDDEVLLGTVTKIS